MKNVFLCKAIAFIACLMCSIGAVAQEAYAVFTEADNTLTSSTMNCGQPARGQLMTLIIISVGSRTVTTFLG